MSSTYHNCFIVNGYSGYDLPQLLRFRDQLYEIILTKDVDAFVAFLKQNNVDLVQFNTTFLIPELQEPGLNLIVKLKQSPNVILLENTTFLIKRSELNSR